MCRCEHLNAHPGCSHAIPRRCFLKGCGVAAAGLLGSRFAVANEPRADRPRVGLVFLADATEKESWP